MLASSVIVDKPVFTPHCRPRRRLSFIVAGCVSAVFAGSVGAETLAQPSNNALERTAANYVQFRADVATIEKAEFTSPSVTREAHRLLGAHEPEALIQGWMAYAALVAADTPEFAQSLQKEVKRSKRKKGTKLRGRDAFIANLAENPAYAMDLKGADAAIEAVLTMTIQDNARITSLGEAFKAQAYAMQKTKWGKKRIGSKAPPVIDRCGERFNKIKTRARGARALSMSDKQAVSPRQFWLRPSSARSLGGRAGAEAQTLHRNWPTEPNADVSSLIASSTSPRATRSASDQRQDSLKYMRAMIAQIRADALSMAKPYA